jgi:hypothetical protein
MTFKRFMYRVMVVTIGCCIAAVGYAADSMVTTDDLLKDSQFKTAYSRTLGSRAKERWLATMTNSAPVRTVTIAGELYQVATPCKPHDCAENNLLLLYSPAKKAAFGKLYERGKTTLIGAPTPTITVELEKMWRREFRQQ